MISIVYHNQDWNHLTPPNSLDVHTTIFPGGEPHVDTKNHSFYSKIVNVNTKIRSMNDFGKLICTLDVIKTHKPAKIHLNIPYFPGARQDRRQNGFAFTAKIYADILNSFKLDRVTILDVHSDVVPAILDNCQALTSKFDRFLKTEDYAGLICPDAGAVKRVEGFNNVDLPVFYGRKHRSPGTGSLSGFSIDELPKSDKPYLLVDDICDGGGTFIGLAQIIPPDIKLHLYVTHGIFSKGFGALLEKFDKIITTDSFQDEKEIEQKDGFNKDRVVIYPWSKV